MPVTAVIGADNPDNITIGTDSDGRLKIKQITDITFNMWDTGVTGGSYDSITGLNNPFDFLDSTSLTLTTATGATQTCYVTYDLGDTYNIHGIYLNWEASGVGCGSKIQVSTDGSTWTDIRTISCGTSETVFVSGVGNARYIRVYHYDTDTNGTSCIVYQLRAYGARA